MRLSGSMVIAAARAEASKSRISADAPVNLALPEVVQAGRQRVPAEDPVEVIGDVIGFILCAECAIIRGAAFCVVGNYYQPQDSIWYLPEAYRNDQHGKLLLMAPSYDRSGTLGFRCASEVE